MFGAVPLLIVPFVLYNLGLLGIFGGGEGRTSQRSQNLIEHVNFMHGVPLFVFGLR